jgi:hypothetical protein
MMKLYKKIILKIISNKQLVIKWMGTKFDSWKS